MNAASMAQAAYATSARATISARGAEFRALANVTGQLAAAAKRKADDHPGYVAALARNLEIWTIFGADVAHADNALPKALRAQIWNIAAFVRTHTLQLLRSEDGATPEILITINRNIMRGLDPDTNAPPAAGAP